MRETTNYFAAKFYAKNLRSIFSGLMKKINTIVLLTFLFFGVLQLKAQSTANYTFATNNNGTLASDINGNTVDMTTGTTPLIGAGLDAAASAVTNIGFDFWLQGNRFTQFSANEDGILQLGGTVVGTNVYTITGGTATLPMLAAFNTDLRTGTTTGKIHYKVVGTAPNRCLVVEFTNMQLFYTTAAAGTSTWQMRLYETSGVVEYVYGTMNVTYASNTNRSPSIGFYIGSATNSFASVLYASHTRSVTNPYAANPAVGSTGDITNLTSSSDGNRRYYRFTPPTIAAPTGLNFTGVTINSMNVNWTAASPTTNILKYAVYYSTDGGTTYTYYGTTNVGTNTLNVTGLTPGTTYDWKVVSVSEGALSTALTGTQATAAGATYYWVGTATADFNTAATWNQNPLGGGLTRSTPLSTDILIIDGAGTTAGAAITAGTFSASTSIGQLKITSNTSATFSSTTSTRTTTITGGGGDDFVIDNGSSLILTNATTANTVAITFSGTGNTGDISGTLTLGGNAANTFTTTGGTSTLVTVKSTGVVNIGSGATLANLASSAATLSFANSSNCNVTGTGTTAYPIPLATWGASSNLTLSGGTSTTGSANVLQPFGNFIYNNSSLASTMSFFVANTVTIQGDLNIQATGSGRFRCVTTGSLTVNGNVNVTNGILEFVNTTGQVSVGGSITVNNASLVNFANGAGTSPTVSVTGSVTVNNTATIAFGNAASSNTYNIGGNLNLNSSGTSSLALSSSTQTLNLTGNFNQTAGSFQIGTGTGTGILKVAGSFSAVSITNSGAASTIEFNGSSSQSVTPGSTFTGTNNIKVSNPAGIAVTGTLPLNAGTTFTAAANGTAVTSGTVTYSTTTTLVYITALGAQTTGSEFPSSSGPVNLTINNTSATTPEVTLSGSRTVSGTLTNTAGRLLLGNNDLTLSGTAYSITSPGTSNMIVTNGSGLFKRAISTTASTSYLFPVGEVTGTIQYTPVTLTFNTNSIARIVGARVVDGIGNINSPTAPTDYLSRYWAFSENGAGGTYNYYINPAIASTTVGEDENGTPSNIKAAYWDGSIWTLSTGTYNTGTGSLISASAGVSQTAAPLSSVEWTGRAAPVTQYYYGGSITTDVSNKDAWWTTADASGYGTGGSHPTAITDINSSFNIQNSTTTTPTMGASITLGSGSKFVIGGGSSAAAFTIPSGFALAATSTVDVTANGSLIILNATVPALGTLNATSTVNFGYTGAQNIPSKTYGTLIFSGSGGVYTLLGATTVNGALTINAGTLDVTTIQITGNATYNFTIASGAKFRTSGTGTTNFPTLFTTAHCAFDVNSTFEYYAASSSTIINNTPSYGNLTISGASTFSITATGSNTVTVAGNFSQTAGTFIVTTGTGANTLNVSGNFSQTAGLFEMGGPSAVNAATVNVTGTTSIFSIAMWANSSQNPSTILFQANDDVTFTGTATGGIGTSTSFDWMSGGTSGTQYPVTFAIKGDFLWNGTGNPYETGSGSPVGFKFNGTGTIGAPQTLTYSGATASYGLIFLVDNTTVVQLKNDIALGTSTAPYSTFVVNGTLDAQGFKITGGNTTIITSNYGFTLGANATLLTSNTSGVFGASSGSIQTVKYTFDPTASYTFYGTANITSTAFQNSTMKNLTLSLTGAAGANKLTVSSATTVTNSLNLNAGIAVTAGTNIISVTNTNTSTAITRNTSATANYVDGPLKWSGASGADYVFPVGNGNTYLPFTISPSTATAPIFTVQAFAAAPSSADGSTLGSLSTTEYWTASFTGTYSQGTVSVGRQTAITAGDVIGRSTSGATGGSYAALGGTVSGNNINTSSATGANLGAFAIATPATSYYYNGGGDVSDVNSWLSVPDGTGLGVSGTNPTVVNGATYTTFKIQNTTTPPTLLSSVALGTGARFIVGGGSSPATFTLPSGANTLTGGAIDVEFNGTFNILNATIPTLGTLNATSTVSYGRAGAQTVTAATYGNLIIGDASTTPATSATAGGIITTAGSLTINTNSTFKPSGNDLNIAGDWTNNGTYTASTQTTTFNGTNALQTISGSSSTPFSTLVVNKGTDVTKVLDITGSGAVTVSVGTTFTAGLLRVSTGGDLTINNAGPTIAAASGLHVNGGNFTSAFTATIQGLINITSGTATFGTGSGSGIVTQSTGSYTMSGGTVNVGGRLEVTASTAGTGVTISGGTLTLCTQGNNSATLASFNMLTTANVSMTGGTVILQSPNSNASPFNDINIITGGTKSLTGGTFQIGNASTAASKTFLINSAVAIGSLTINATNAPTAKLVTALVLNGDVTNNGGTLEPNSLDITLKGSWTNNGTFNCGTRKVTFNSTTTGKTISGTLTGTTGKFYDLTFNGSGGTWSFGANNADVANAFTISAGTVTAPSTTLQIGGAYSNGGTFTHNSGTVNLNGSASNQSVGGTTTTTFYNLTLTNTAGTLPGATLGRAEIVSGVLNLAAGILTTTSTNSMTISNTANTAVTRTASASSNFVSGPLLWTLPTISTATDYTFPLGKSTTYLEFKLSPSSTTAGASATIEAFLGAPSAADGTTLSALSTSEYWTVTTPTSTYTQGTVSMERQSTVTAGSVIGRSATGPTGGSYSSLGGTVSGTGNGIATSNATGDAKGFYCFATPKITYAWVGGTSGAVSDWATSTNWSPNGTPTSANNVTIGTTTYPCILSGTGASNNLTLSGAGDLQLGSGASLTVAGTFSSTSSVTPTFDCASTLLMTSTSAQNVPAFSYGSLNLAGGARTFASGFTTAVCGALTPGSSNTLTGSTINFNGTGAQLIPALTYTNLTISNARSGAAITLANSATITVSGVVDVSTLSGNTWNNTGNTFTYNTTASQTIAPLNYNNLSILGARGGTTISFPAGTIGIAGTFTIGWSGSTTISRSSSNIINYNGTGAQTILPFYYFNLTISNARISNPAITLATTGGLSSGIIDVAGTFSVTATGTYSVSVGTSTVNFSSTTINQPIPAFYYYNITNYVINTTTNTNAPRTWANSGTIDINAGFTPSTGTNTIDGSTVRYSNSDIYTTWTLTDINTNVSGKDYNNLIFSGISSWQQDVGVNISTVGDVTFNGGGELYIGYNTTANTLSVGGNYTQSNNSYLYVSLNTGTATLFVAGNASFNGGNVYNVFDYGAGNINVTGNLNISSGNIYNVDDHGNGTINVTGSVNFTGGTIYNAYSYGAGTIIVGGDFTQNGGDVYNAYGYNSTVGTISVTGTYKLLSNNALYNATYYLSSYTTSGVFTAGAFNQTNGTTYVSYGTTSGTNSTMTISGATTISGGFFIVERSTGTGTFTTGSLALSGAADFHLIYDNNGAPSTTVTVNGTLSTSATSRIYLNYGGSASRFGTIICNDFTTTSTGIPIVDFNGNNASNQIQVKGNFDKSGTGKFTTISSNPAKGFVFNKGSGTQTFSYTGTGSDYTNYVIESGSTVQMLTGLVVSPGDLASPPSSFTVNGTLDCVDKTISSGGSTNTTFTLASGAILKSSNVNGIWNSTIGSISTSFGTTKGVFNSGANYEFYGTSNITSNFKNTTMNNLNVNLTGTSGNNKLTLNADAIAGGTLFMTKGNIYTGSNRMILGTSTSNKGTLSYTRGTSGLVVGNMRRWFSGTNSTEATGLYPLGQEVSGVVKVREYFIQYPTTAPTAGGYLDVNFNNQKMWFNGLPIAGIPAVGACSTFDVTSTADQGYWIATPTTLNGGTYTLALTGEDLVTITNLCQLTLLKRVGTGNWLAPGNHLEPTGSISMPTVSRSGLTGFSNFGFGGGDFNPLPVELALFNAECQDGNGLIKWTTVSEFNSKEFVLERSIDGGRTFTIVTTVQGAGNSNSIINYSYLDKTVSSAQAYYRLKMVDFDGTSKISTFISLDCESTQNQFSIYYSPEQGIVVKTNLITGSNYQVEVFDVAGKKIISESKQLDKGSSVFTLTTNNILANGIYLVRINNNIGSNVITKKVSVTQ